MAKNTLTMIDGADLLAEVELVKAQDEEDGVAEILVWVPVGTLVVPSLRTFLLTLLGQKG